MAINNTAFAKQVGQYLGVSYGTLDCQGLVKRALRDLGENVQWRGSNDMWRNHVHGNCTIAQAKLTPGILLFTIKHDGKENKDIYKDGINAAHVGVYVGDLDASPVIHSTPDKVQYDKFPNSSRWTHAAYLNYVDYGTEGSASVEERIDAIIAELEVLKIDVARYFDPA